MFDFFFKDATPVTTATFSLKYSISSIVILLASSIGACPYR